VVLVRRLDRPLVAFFLAARVRRIAQYTVPDLLEQRYNPTARLLGTLAIILAYVTIAAYQFRGGGWILAIVSDGASAPRGHVSSSGTIVLFTALAGMMSIVTVDIFNGIIITLGILIALPYMVFAAGGGVAEVLASLPEGHTSVMGGHNVLWVIGVALPTFLLILGESGMYQKFFSPEDERAAKQAVVGMVRGDHPHRDDAGAAGHRRARRLPGPGRADDDRRRGASETVILYIAGTGCRCCSAPSCWRRRRHRPVDGEHVPAGAVHQRQPRRLRALHLPRHGERRSWPCSGVRRAVRRAGAAAADAVRDGARHGALCLLARGRQPDARAAGRVPLEARHAAGGRGLHRRAGSAASSASPCSAGSA
jgi:hypothetical protein